MSTSKKIPTHRAYLVTKTEGDAKGKWTEIGAAWSQKDGKGLNVKLKADLPAGQREIVIRAVTPKPEVA